MVDFEGFLAGLIFRGGELRWRLGWDVMVFGGCLGRVGGL